MKRLIVLTSIAVLISACSTIMEGSQEDVMLTTPGATDARCKVENKYFRYVINPPRTFHIERTSEPYRITCLAPGNRVKTLILPVGYEDKAFYNVSNGVIPGVATDAASGALFAYTRHIEVDFTGTKPSAMPLPDYQVMLQENPLMKGMEEFRPGVSALQRDENTAVQPMELRAPGSYDDSFGSLSTGDDQKTGNSQKSSGTTSSTTTSSAPFTPALPTVADNLTKAANPHVFGAQPMYMTHKVPSWNSDDSGSSSSTGSGFAGGTNTTGTTTSTTGTATSAPMPLFNQ